MEDEKKHHQIWEWLKNIAIGCGAVLAIFQVCHLFASFGSDLKATIEYNRCEVPPTVRRALDIARDQFRNLTKEKEFEGILAKTQLSTNSARNFASDLQLLVSDKVAFNLDLPFGTESSGVYYIYLRNTGKLLIKDVTLRIPNATTARITTEAGTTNLFNTSDVIPLGNVRSKENAEITVWTKFLGGPYDEDAILLRHSEGLGSISFLSPVANPWRWLADRWSSLWPLIVFSLLTIWLLAADLRKSWTSEPVNPNLAPPTKNESSGPKTG